MIGSRVGNYVVERPLGQGGMGSVFVARHPDLGREVAIKFLDEELSSHPELSARFLEEARITAKLQHPNIVGILDFGEVAGRYYYMMELLRGRDLAAIMRETSRFPVKYVLECLLQVCSGLSAAHDAGIVHRDLKPSNVFVLDGESLRIKLMDFGVAKVMSSEHTQTGYGQILGTPTHMSPEQALGQMDRISPKSDLYALGVVAYEMLTGVPVFSHESPMMLMIMHVRDPVTPIRQHRPDLDESTAQLVESCLAKDPAARPASARDLAEQLAVLLSLAERTPAPRAVPSGSAANANPTVQKGPSGNTQARTPRPAPTRAPTEPVNRNPAKTTTQHFLSRQSTTRAPGTTTLSDSDRSALGRLLSRMQQRGDFPAFARNLGEVSKRADHESAFSAEQLANSILKDFALTAKLMRVVNSAYSARFHGKVYSVRHAIVILGFERVRSIAVSISLFKTKGPTRYAERASESAIGTLVSGEVAHQLAETAGIADSEQAMLCAMFHGLGKHLVVVYMPEQYDQILELTKRHALNLDTAAERVLGISFRRLGVGVAEHWQLPDRLVDTMTNMNMPGAPLLTETGRLSALADLSNQLVATMLIENPQERSRSIAGLLTRNRSLMTLEPEELADVLTTVETTLKNEYASLLGFDPRASRLMRGLTSTPPSLRPQPNPSLLPTLDTHSGGPRGPSIESGRDGDSKMAQPARGVRLGNNRVAGKAVRPIVVPLRLGTRQEDSSPDASSPPALANALIRVAERLKIPRLLALRANAGRTELLACRAVGDDAEALCRELSVPLHSGRTANDAFSIAYYTGRDFRFEDTFSAQATTWLPQRYYEVLGSSCVLILACPHRTLGTTVLVADAERPEGLPSVEAVAQSEALRQMVAEAAL